MCEGAWRPLAGGRFSGLVLLFMQYVCCVVLVFLCCGMLQCAVLCRGVLLCVVLLNSAPLLCFPIIFCAFLCFHAQRVCLLQCSMLCCVILCFAVLCCVILWCAVLIVLWCTCNSTVFFSSVLYILWCVVLHYVLLACSGVFLGKPLFWALCVLLFAFFSFVLLFSFVHFICFVC